MIRLPSRLLAAAFLAALLLTPTSASAVGRRIACLGDSITNQYGSYFQTADGERCTVVARDGASTDAVLDLFRERVRGGGYTDLIVRAGRNDIYSGRGVASAQRNLGTIYEEARAAGMRVVAVSMLPHEGYASWSPSIQRQTDELNVWLSGAPVDVFVNADSTLADPDDPTPETPRLRPTYDRGDHLHLSNDGKCVLANVIAQRAFGGSGDLCVAGLRDTMTNTNGGVSTEEVETPFEQILPRLALPIPGFSGFSDITVFQDGENRTLDIAFIAEYIVALYRYAIGILVTIAMVMVVVGGFQYVAARGNASAIAEARNRITNAVLGIVIALGSYLILAAINPELVEFRNIRIDLIRRRDVVYGENGGVDNGCTDSCGTRRPITNSDFDELFRRYAGCARVDWRMLKAVAFVESGLNPEVVNRYGFVGLFQVGPRFCSLGTSYCTTEALQDPAVNTYVAATEHLGRAASAIRSACPAISDGFTFTMLMYYGHNSGIGALRHVLRETSCSQDYDTLLAAAAAFQRERNPDIPNAEGRMATSQRVAERARALGVTTADAEGSCPGAPPPPSTSE